MAIKAKLCICPRCLALREYEKHSTQKEELQMATPTPEMSLGEKRVRADFMAGDNDIVDEIKEMTAQLINLCEDLKNSGNDPRTAALAQTEYETACMYAVKAATATYKA